MRSMDDQLDPIHFVQDSPQDPDFLALDPLKRTSAGDIEWSAKEPFNFAGALPAAVTLDPVLQTYGDANHPILAEPAVNVALVGHGNRDDEESCKDAPSGSEQSFACPNPGCKHSAGRSHFKRLERLKRHLKTCKHKKNSSTPTTEGEEQLLAQPTSTPILSHELQPLEARTEEFVNDSRVKRRSRSESDDEFSDESFMREMMKRHKRMAEDVKEKKDALRQAEEELKLVEKTIQIWKDSLQEP
ncbi:hypothetical protein IL306_004929 [Fusarium sp. DS 682]|nr:hypothetical protein IL306_004929 [Fusarium sp. DS 682]